MARGKNTKISDHDPGDSDEDHQVPSDKQPFASISTKRPRPKSGVARTEGGGQDTSRPSPLKKSRPGETARTLSPPVLTSEQINILKSNIDPDLTHSLMVGLLANALEGTNANIAINLETSISVRTFLAIGPSEGASQPTGKGQDLWFRSDAFTFFRRLCDSFNSRLPPGSNPTIYCYDTSYRSHLQGTPAGESKKSGPAEALRRHQYPKVAKGQKQWLGDAKMIFLPTNVDGNHWTLVVIERKTIEPPAFTIRYLDSWKSTKESDADRLTRRDRYIDPVIDWINEEFRFQQYEDGNEEKASTSWRKEDNDSCLQQNASDCGVFVCTNAILSLYRLPRISIDRMDMDRQRLKIASALLFPKYLEYTTQMPQG